MGEKSKYVAQIENIYFLSNIGASLRWATNDIAREELPDDIRLLLRRLERLEAKALKQRPESGHRKLPKQKTSRRRRGV